MAEPDAGPPAAADAVAAGALAVAAAAVLLSLFMHWCRAEATSVPVAFSADIDANGWELLSGLDIVLATAAGGALGLALALVADLRIRAVSLWLQSAGFAIALGLVVRRAIDPPVHVVAGRADVVAALGPYVAMAGLASMALAAALAALWRG